VTQDFRPSFFSPIDPTWGPDSRPYAISHLARKSMQMSPKSVSQGLMTPRKSNVKLRIPQFFVLCIIKIWYGDIFSSEIFLLAITYKRSCKPEMTILNLRWGKWPRGNRSRSNQQLASSFFRQLVTTRTTTKSYNHFPGHYKFDWVLKQIMVMIF
jgi:hypothetical protein